MNSVAFSIQVGLKGKHILHNLTMKLAWKYTESASPFIRLPTVKDTAVWIAHHLFFIQNKTEKKRKKKHSRVRSVFFFCFLIFLFRLEIGCNQIIN